MEKRLNNEEGGENWMRRVMKELLERIRSWRIRNELKGGSSLILEMPE